MGFFTAVKKFFGGTGTASTAIRDAPGDLPGDVDVPKEQEKEENGAELAAEAARPFPESRSGNQDKQEDVHQDLAESNETAGDGELLARLRAAEPRLSVWLEIILDDVDTPDEKFWSRLTFLLRSLDAKEEEISRFEDDFKKWLSRMEYGHVDEFRSELQYRLALALDLEDEEDERNRLFLKFSKGLERTRQQLTRQMDRLFSGSSKLDAAFWEEMEEIFIMSDLGYDAAMNLVNRLKEQAAAKKIDDPAKVRELLNDEIGNIFAAPRKIVAVNRPEVVLLIGVNGVGKTTTIGKLAHREKMNGKRVLIAAADTFRAAAVEQLGVWAERVGADFFARKQGADPASVAWEALDKAKKEDFDILFVDTAGRLQTKANLMEELGKIRQVLAKKHPGAPHRTILVLDATTGQNALSQAKLFREAAGIDELVITKLDGTAKGGVAIAVAMEQHLPISFVGLGEGLEDLRPFDGQTFAKALLGETKEKS